MPLIQYQNGAFFASGVEGQERALALMGLGWSPHPDNRQVWFTRSPYLAAPMWDWADKSHADTVAALGSYAWNYATSFAEGPISDCGVPSVRLPAGEELYPFQVAGIQRAVLRPKLLLADEMGLGKSPQALIVSNMIRPKRTIIGCPGFLIDNWLVECQRWLVDPQPIAILDGAKKSIPDEGVVIVPYSRAHNFETQILAGPRVDLCILDELHFLKNRAARRTGPWLAKGGIAARATRVLGLSGSPMPNNASELYQPLTVLGGEMMRGVSEAYFRDTYCQVVKLKAKVHLKSGGSIKKEVDKVVSRSATLLNAELRASGTMVRRLKKDVLKQLPPKNQYFVHMTPTAEIACLVKEESDLYTQLQTRIMTSQELIALKGHVANVRARLGLLKAPKIAEYVQWIFDSGEDRIVLFMLHTEAIRHVAETFKRTNILVHTLTGAESPHERANRVKDFQAPGGGRKLAIGQILAAGVGLTMTSARYAILGEISWTPTDNDQAVDRIHRITQMRQCEVPILTFPHAVEQRVIRTNAEKKIGIVNALDVNLKNMLAAA